jgi:hypothetical protein
MAANELKQRISRMKEKLSSDSFYEHKGLGNEVPFYIFDYDSSDEVLLRNQIMYLSNEDQEVKDKIILVDLFDLIINELDNKNYIEKTIKLEKKKGKDASLKGLRRFLKITEDDSVIKNIIESLEISNKAVLIIGLGKVWPILRGSELLNNLHSVVTNSPLILFYPGQYNQHDLKLFSKIPSEHYYRAFRLEPSIKGGIHEN